MANEPADGQLNVRVGSSYDPKGLDAAEKAVQSLVGTTSKASNQISANLSKSANAAVVAGGSIAKGSNQAAFALTNLGRVAQDAPFGFIGIQNNLNPLLESFQRLKAESGSSSLALKALGQSLIGPAGIGLALSLVTSAITLYIQYQQKSKKATEDAKKSSDEYILTLNQVTQAQLRGAQNATKEVAELQVLFGAYQNANLPLKARKEAYLELQKEYPAYFGSIKFEQEASEKTKKAYEALTTAIIATGRARAAVDLIAKNETRRLENEQKIVDLGKEQLQNQISLERAQKRGTVAGGAGILASAGSSGIAISENQAIKFTQAQINNLKTDSNKLDENNLLLVKSINAELERGAKIQGSVGSVEKEGYKRIYGDAKLAVTDLIQIIGKLPDVDLTKRFKIPEFVEQTNYALNQLRSNFGYTDDELTNFITNYGIGLDALLNKTIDFNNQVSGALNNGIISAFSGIGEAIGSSLAAGTNVLEALGSTLLGVFGDLLVNLGKIAIQTGIGIAAIKTALKSLNPVVAIGAGVALVALGSLIKGKVSNLGGGGGQQNSNSRNTAIPQFANGGLVYGNTLAQVGEYPGARSNPEVIAPLNKLKDIIGDRSNNVVLGGSLSISMRELVLGIRAEEKLMGRTG